jgi:hypothetical protein
MVQPSGTPKYKCRPPEGGRHGQGLGPRLLKAVGERGQAVALVVDVEVQADDVRGPAADGDVVAVAPQLTDPRRISEASCVPGPGRAPASGREREHTQTTGREVGGDGRGRHQAPPVEDLELS